LTIEKAKSTWPFFLAFWIPEGEWEFRIDGQHTVSSQRHIHIRRKRKRNRGTIMARSISQLRRGLLLFLALFILSGCGRVLTVVYYSDPPGAVLYQGQQSYGFTPVTLKYNIPEEMRKQGYVDLQGPYVLWASGAKAEASSIRADIGFGRYLQQFTFVRPNVSGREVDMSFALELERLKLAQQQTQLMQIQVQTLQNLFENLNRQQSPALLNTFRNCTSNVSGNMIYTQCY
jgi:hypothetical protein